MPKYSNFALVASFLGLWIDSFFSTPIQIIVGFTLIFTFGLLHGANDLMLIDTINPKKNSLSYYRLLVYYISLVAVVAVLFYFLPSIALLLFLLISSYHFGEQQWQIHDINYPKWVRIVFYFSYGSFILLLLFSFHEIEVQRIIFEITAYSITSNWNQILLCTASILLAAFMTYIYLNSKQIRKQLVLELFYLLVFAIIFKSSSLIWGFALYFVLWHSIPSIIDQTKFLYGTFDRTNLSLYFKSGILFWTISLVGLALFYMIFRKETLFNALFFSFLAAITFPHVLVIIKMFTSKSAHSTKI